MKLKEAKRLDKICEFILKKGKGPITHNEIKNDCKLNSDQEIYKLGDIFGMFDAKHNYQNQNSIYVNDSHLKKLYNWYDNTFTSKVRAKRNYFITVLTFILSIIVVILTIISIYINKN